MTSTNTAQRRLLESLAELDTTPGSLTGLRIGLVTAIEFTEGAGHSPLADVYRRLDELAAAVAEDRKGVPQHG